MPKEIPRGVVPDVLDFDIVVNKFDLQSRSYVHFQNITLGQVLTSLSPCFEVKSATTYLLQGWLWH